MTKQEKANCRKIADHYGWKAGSAKLIKEMGELKEAIEKQDAMEAKLKEYTSAGLSYADIAALNEKYKDVQLHVWEEVADVEICLHHFKYLNNAKAKVAEYRKQKIARQLQRMEAGE